MNKKSVLIFSGGVALGATIGVVYGAVSTLKLFAWGVSKLLDDGDIKYAPKETEEKLEDARVDFSRRNGRTADSKFDVRKFYFNTLKNEKEPNELLEEGNFELVLDKISFDTLKEAQEVLSHLEEEIEMYGVVSVLDVLIWTGYDRRELKKAWRYGWRTMEGTSIVRKKGHYHIAFKPCHTILEDESQTNE